MEFETNGVNTSLNTQKIIIGGLVAGIVIILLNILAQFVLGDSVQQEMSAGLPGSADTMTMSVAATAAGIVMKFIIGVILVWLYAAVRPRFGAGPRTAFYVAVCVWILGAIFFSDFLLLGMMSAFSYVILEVMQFLSFLAATLVGAWIYTE
ncbi:MAG: hypothetical protein KJ077_36170 [Anaerolineae bacterium]|nr:hypothetical protein [Anaerolineae bacterium]